ncbi:aldose 1-epimerase [Bauldia sp.]|uniref:aldose 1-epimerase n=1 Tax=Bauldia sp. TaxID=2575872 RepID=UPI003BAA350B
MSIEIGNASLSLMTIPETGGALTRFDWLRDGARVPVFRPASETTIAEQGLLAAAMFPMVPFVNRIPGNVLTAGDQRYAITPNFDEPWALHGCGWQMPWTVEASTADSLTLGLEVDGKSFAFPFLARQIFSLDGKALVAAIEVRNTGRETVPIGFGFHPYLPLGNTTLRFEAEFFWLEGPGYLPTDAISIPPELSFDVARPVPQRWRNNCYTGWNGKALVGQPELGYDLTIEADPVFTDLMLFTAGDGETFALEPQTNTVAAVSTARTEPRQNPMRLLEPGDTLAGSCRFAVIPH